jgi:ribosomal 30S subunit maturation factor RimM
VEDLLEFLARALVDNPDAVSVEGFDEDDGTIVLEVGDELIPLVADAVTRVDVENKVIEVNREFLGL